MELILIAIALGWEDMPAVYDADIPTVVVVMPESPVVVLVK